ncbi:MAG: UvrD-helicase domain-containing protein [Myxococcaceae bacterium]
MHGSAALHLAPEPAAPTSALSAPGGGLALDRNLALMAGAGAGKTYNLVTLCLHLLCGARASGEPLAPARLCLLTFTDKAAGELRARLRQRLDRLATGTDPLGAEPELRDALAALGRPFPPQDEWRRLRDELGAATVGTFHSVCAQLLRHAPGGAGVDPGFELLDERDAAGLVHDLAERLVLDALEAAEAPVVQLCSELGFTGEGRAKALVDHLREAFGKLREEGLAPTDLATTQEKEARAEFDAEVAAQAGLAAAAEAAMGADKRPTFGALLAASRTALDGLTLEGFEDRFPRLFDALASEPKISYQRGAFGDAIKQLKWRALGHDDRGFPGLAGFFGAWAIAPYERAFVSLLSRLAERHRAQLERRGVLDFTELLVRARDLLRDHPAVRAEAQERVGALLVDEFQDTNRLQLEIVTLLAERRDGAPRACPEGGGGLPLEPGLLCAVGDRKQSIYEFRGADVSVFGELAKKIETEGGARAYLQVNRRSSPPLLEFFNGVFARVMSARTSPRDYEVAYLPDDDLLAHREQRFDPPCVDRLVYTPADGDLAEDCRAADAEAIARHVRSLLDPSSPLVVFTRDEVARRPVGGDVAILFRRFSYLEVYRQALIRAGVPHRVVRGRGFYGAQEVLDLASLLALVADPSDALSLAAVLRSPLVAVSDATLLALARAGGGRLRPGRVLDEPAPAGEFPLPPDEAARLERFRALFPRLRAEKDRLSVRALLEVAIEETGYRVAVAGTPFGEQALVNLEKLVELAARHDAPGAGGCAPFARELLALADTEPTEAQADIVDSQDPRAVSLLTIHQAKGLEWPIVFVPDLGAQKKSFSGQLALERRQGLAIKPWFSHGGARARSPRFDRIAGELKRREDAEFRRTLYVALTRARDLLVLSGVDAKQKPGTWWALLDEAIGAEPKLRALVRDLPTGGLPLPAPAPCAAAPTTPGDLARVDRALGRVRAPSKGLPRSAVLPVTQLQDYFRCPRRYLYAHLVGLSERPQVFDFDEEDGPGRAAGDSRARGTLAHRLLERVPLGAVGGASLREGLERQSADEGTDPGSPVGIEVLGWVEGFLKGDFARKLGAAGEGRAHRELPFLLRLGGEGGGFALHLKGQIDLLFEDDDGAAVVVDYKASRRPPGGLEPYAFQLDCYALAARRFVADGVALRVGICFLREERPEPELRTLTPGDASAFERLLVETAQQLCARPLSGEWPGCEPGACEAMGCGYRYRCHPARGL